MCVLVGQVEFSKNNKSTLISVSVFNMDALEEALSMCSRITNESTILARVTYMLCEETKRQESDLSVGIAASRLFKFREATNSTYKHSIMSKE